MTFKTLATILLIAAIILLSYGENLNILSKLGNISGNLYKEFEAADIIQQSQLVPVDVCSKIWRYNLTCALKYTLSRSEIAKIEDLALELRGKDIKESAWNILEWEEKNIKYDQQKAILPTPELVFYRSGGIITDIVVVRGQNNTYQTPYETIQRGKGVCRDYAILTAGLLLAMGYSPVYIFMFEFEGPTNNHTAAGIKINEEYFVIDQHPPIMDLGTYYMHWKYYATINRDIIKKVYIYEVRMGQDLANVTFVGLLSEEDLKKYNYALETKDLEKIRLDLSNMLKKNFHLTEDLAIKNIDKTYLPRGYIKGITWTYKLPNYADYYNPEFHREFVKFLYKHITRDDKVVRDLNYYNRFYLKLEKDENDLKIILNLAKI